MVPVPGGTCGSGSPAITFDTVKNRIEVTEHNSKNEKLRAQKFILSFFLTTRFSSKLTNLNFE
jgi:hypothetical protein